MGRTVRVIAAAVVCTGCSAGIAFGAVTSDRLWVRVYDTTGRTSDDREQAMKRAGAILKDADVSVEWRDCSPPGSAADPACGHPPAPGELIVRLLHSPQTDASRTLGEAFVDRVTAKGVLATVFVDRIEALAAIARADLPAVVARVMAHEIGHLLLGSNAHSRTGLMRDTWTLQDLTRDRQDDWMFSRAEVDRLRRMRSAS